MGNGNGHIVISAFGTFYLLNRYWGSSMSPGTFHDYHLEHANTRNQEMQLTPGFILGLLLPEKVISDMLLISHYSLILMSTLN